MCLQAAKCTKVLFSVNKFDSLLTYTMHCIMFTGKLKGYTEAMECTLCI